MSPSPKTTIDGNGLVLNGGELVFAGNNPGTVTFTYNWFKNTYSQHISNGAGTGSVTAKYNLFDQALSVGGARLVRGRKRHAADEWLGVDVQHWLSAGPAATGTQGFMFEPGNGTTVSNLTAQYNTVIAAGTSANLVNFFFGLGGPGVPNVSNANFNNNYVDPTGVSSGSPFIRSQVAGSHGANNVNMVTGAAMAGSTW
jgi:hypothetical protein